MRRWALRSLIAFGRGLQPRNGDLGYRHRPRGQEFHANGTLLMFGTFGNPQEEGAMAVFTTREAAEEFAKGDPFVRNCVIRNWFIREWNEALVNP